MELLTILAFGLAGIAAFIGLDLLMQSRHEKTMQEIDKLLAILEDDDE